MALEAAPRAKAAIIVAGDLGLLDASIGAPPRGDPLGVAPLHLVRSAGEGDIDDGYENVLLSLEERSLLIGLLTDARRKQTAQALLTKLAAATTDEPRIPAFPPASPCR